MKCGNLLFSRVPIPHAYIIWCVIRSITLCIVWTHSVMDTITTFSECLVIFPLAVRPLVVCFRVVWGRRLLGWILFIVSYWSRVPVHTIQSDSYQIPHIHSSYGLFYYTLSSFCASSCHHRAHLHTHLALIFFARYCRWFQPFFLVVYCGPCYHDLLEDDGLSFAV